MAQLTFENPTLLWLLFVLPLFWMTHFYFLRHTKRNAMKFANFRVLKRITGKKLITRNYTVLFVRSFIILFAIIAASQAVFFYEGQTNENAFIIALDSSASMQAQDIQPTRLEAAKNNAVLFLDGIQGTSSYGLVTFSGVTLVEETLTEDKNRVRTAIQAVEPIQAGGTDIPGAIITATNLLVGTEKGKVVVLVTDGSNTLETFTSESIQQGVNYAKENQVMVHTIGIGSTQGPLGYLPQYYNISPVYNEQNLEYIANQTGGEYVQAVTGEELLEAYTSIAGESQTALIRRELAPGLMALVLLLLFLEWGLISTRFRSIP